MSCCLNAVDSLSGFGHIVIRNRDRASSRVCSSIGTLRLNESNWDSFWGRTVDSQNQNILSISDDKAPYFDPVYAQSSGSIGKAMRWWEKSMKPNMIEINSAQDLVDNLLNACDRLVIVEFYSPGCGGCKALHAKICQLAETNSNAIFLKVNCEDHKPMCSALHVHVLPFFRFYRGAQGRVCSFSCTNATIKKFKDALAKHGTDQCSLGPAKGLEESELVDLASIGLISMVPYSDKNELVEDVVVKETVKSYDDHKFELKEDNAMVMA